MADGHDRPRADGATGLEATGPNSPGKAKMSVSTEVRAEAGEPPDPQILLLLHAITSLNEQHRPFVLQVIAALQGEGTSRVASALADAAAREIGLPVLLLDCSAPAASPAAEMVKSPSLIDAFRDSASSEAALRSLGPNLLLARLSNAASGVLGMSPQDLQLMFDALRKRFAMVVLDCPAALSNPGAVGLARSCDGTALVVRAETTPRAAVMQARTLIDRLGGQVIGVVLNRHRSHLPSWLRRWL
ncbi:hypothetical protein [Lichenicoccus sp.]|uniref:hypothetical protein n=1 Tax=Lichenicoccus sp. TaxID=2781899 RepID=UPI003D0F8258